MRINIIIHNYPKLKRIHNTESNTYDEVKAKGGQFIIKQKSENKNTEFLLHLLVQYL